MALTDRIGHVNNVTYVRYAETARVYFTHNFALHIDPAHKTEWMNLVSNKGLGIILRSIKIDYKFVRTMHTLASTSTAPPLADGLCTAHAIPRQGDCLP